MAKAKLKRISRKAPKRRSRWRYRKSFAISRKNAQRLLESIEAADRASKVIAVKAAWDAEARVWYIEDSSLPGLHIEANSPIELYKKLPGAIEDLLEGSGEREVPFEFIAPGYATITT